jgi:hypothetical protein
MLSAEQTIISNLVEVSLPNPRAFLRVKETLTRIGLRIWPETEGGPATLLQVCHILHKRGRYFIVHHKELEILDGHDNPLTEVDILRRDHIVSMVQGWKLLTVADPAKVIMAPTGGNHGIRVIRHVELPGYRLISQYNIGRKSGKKDAAPIQSEGNTAISCA